ncbi:unnamed protein product [Effrenium voratum]|nr:unnamed protein product [Effrenium voratum]
MAVWLHSLSDARALFLESAFAFMGRWRNKASQKDRNDRNVKESSGLECLDGDCAAWVSRISIDPALALLTISMSKIGLSDADMERWCAWFRNYLPRRKGSGKLQFGQVDFAENRLTAAGIGQLFSTLADLQIPVQVLKLHHNRIAEGSSVAAYLQLSGLHELHLSHNELDAEASASIVAAAVRARDSFGALSYPRRVGKGHLAPLWVRLEQNFIDHGAFAKILDAKLGDRGMRTYCDARSKWCTPHSCVQQAALSVHLKNLVQQRRPPGGRSDSLDSTGPWQIDGPEVAQILRFDWEKGAWVPDVIEVLPPELGETDDLSQGLKALIGMGSVPGRDAENTRVLSQEVGQTIGADLLRSLRGGRGQAQTVERAVEVKEVETKAVEAKAAKAAKADDADSALRIEAPEFQPGARCFLSDACKEPPEDLPIEELWASTNTSAGASDATENSEATGADVAESPNPTPDSLSCECNSANPGSAEKEDEETGTESEWTAVSNPDVDTHEEHGQQIRKYAAQQRDRPERVAHVHEVFNLREAEGDDVLDVWRLQPPEESSEPSDRLGQCCTM